jgi:hypothetical protein
MRVRTLTALAAVVAALLAAAAANGAGLLERAKMSPGGASVQEPNRLQTETYDDLLVRVEERAPGFGGMFIDPTGKLVVYLLDASQLAVTRSAIEAVFGPARIPAAGVRAVRGKYVVSQLAAWTRSARALFEMPGVTLVDLDEAKNRVTVGVENESRRQAVTQALSTLGIPRAAVVITVTGPIRPVDSH